MNYTESPVVFEVAGEYALGLLAEPEMSCDRGVLIVVGGPQYRAGSHRQFVLLARRLAAQGYSVFRFDCRGMGDSGGAMRSFEAFPEDIGAAIDVFFSRCPSLRRCVLWGLCDAASAILMYQQSEEDARVDGVVLLNPWVRSETGLAQTQVKHYYGQRLRQREFWLRLLTGKMHVMDSLGGFLRSLWTATRRPVASKPDGGTFREHMATGWKKFRGKVLLILSGRDYTAKEFLEYANTNPAWSGLLADRKVSRLDLIEADHTFSTAKWRVAVEDETLRWLADGWAAGDKG